MAEEKQEQNRPLNEEASGATGEATGNEGHGNQADKAAAQGAGASSPNDEQTGEGTGAKAGEYS